MHTKKLGTAVLILSVLYGCATAPAKQETGTRIYPLPPEEPRIVYLRSFKGPADFAKSNIFDTLFGKPPQPTMNKPYGVFARDGKIYVTASLSSVVLVMDTKNGKLDYLGTHGQGKLSQPIGVAAAQDGTVFVSDVSVNKVIGFKENGDVRTVIGSNLVNPAGLAINDELGRLYVADSQGHSVQVFSLSGSHLFGFGKRGMGDGEFNYPTNLAIDQKTGKVFVVDTQNFRVQIFDRDGKFLDKFGTIGDRPGYFARPRGIALDSEGHIYVSDAAFNNFQIFNDKYEILLFVGQAGRAAGEFSTIAGMYIDEQDRIYAVDQFNKRVQVFQYLSEKWKREHPDEYKKYAPQ